MLRYLAIRVILISGILVASNVVYNTWFYHRDLMQKSDKILELRDSQKKADVLYFAESSNVNYREDDSTQKSISELCNLFFPGLRLIAVNNVAAHAGIYKGWLDEIDLKNHTPKAIVITLNLRSFDAAWIHSKLETPLREAQVLVKPYPNILNRFLLALQAFDNKSEAEREQDMLRQWREAELTFPYAFRYKSVTEWDQAMAQGGHLNPDGSWNAKKIELACHYIKAYAFNLDESNPRIKDFDAIVKWGEKNRIPLYLNLLAENLQYADSLVGKDLVFLMKQNRDYLVKRYSSANCKVIDNLELVPGIDFTDQDWTTEHYGYRGRMYIARNLANGMKEQFKSAYLNAY